MVNQWPIPWRHTLLTMARFCQQLDHAIEGTLARSDVFDAFNRFFAEAIEVYRAQELEKRLEMAYQEDAAESEAVNSQWEQVDAEVKAWIGIPKNPSLSK